MLSKFFYTIRNLLSPAVTSKHGQSTAAPFTSAIAHGIRSKGALTNADYAQRRPRISIITLNHNGARLLDALYASIDAHNSYLDLEFILVDHASTDNSLEVARGWQMRLPAFRIVVCDQNHSFSYSNNRAAEVATGDVLFFVNNDIQFVDDAIPRLLAALHDSGDGVIGMKQFKSKPGQQLNLPAPYHHIGVRFRWARRLRYLTPYEVVPSSRDSELSRLPAHFPAVTGALMMCQRADFLGVGGFGEDYIYGYEDIDLCLKFRIGLGRAIISVNDIYAFHEDGSTRKKRPGKIRRKQHRANIETFDRRCGPALRREMLGLILGDDGSSFGRPLKICAIPPDGKEKFAAWPFLHALAEAKGWIVHVRKAKLKGQMTVSADLVLNYNPAFSPHQIKSKFAHTAFIAMTNNGLSGWKAPGYLEGYDIAFTTSDAAADAVREATGIRPTVLALNDLERAADAFVDAVRTRVQTRVRFAFKLGTVAAKRDPDLRAIVHDLKRAGHHARIDLPNAWLDMLPLGDDVAIAWPGAELYVPVPGQLNLAFGTKESFAFAKLFDAFLEGLSGDTEADVTHILNAWQTLGAPRTQGPADPPLFDLRGKRHENEPTRAPSI